MSTLNSALELWANPLIDAATSRSDFDLRTLKKSRTTIYVGVSPDNLKRLRPLLQVFYQQAIDFHTRKEPDPTEEPYPVLYLMDEFASLGKLTQFQDGIAFFAGYRVRMLMIVQDTNQLETNYGRPGKETFLSCCAVRLTYAANSYDTAKLISNVLGTFGAATTYGSISSSLGFSTRPGTKSESHGETGRALLLPHEVMQLPRDQEIVMVEATPPVRAKKIVYYKDPAFSDRLRPAVVLPQIQPLAASLGDIPSNTEPGRQLQAVVTPLSDAEMAALAAELGNGGAPG
jgi:type IV secretion system protein VirD4